MEFQLLGVDPAMYRLLETIREHPSHTVVAWYESEDHLANLQAWFPDGVNGGKTAALTCASDGQAVIVGGGGEQESREEKVRELARLGVPLILVQPACSAIFALELDMIQRDTGAMLLPFHLNSLHPAIATLARWVWHPEVAPVGASQQLVLERTARQRDRNTIHASLARDSLLLRQLAGDFQQVGAMESSTEHGEKANMSVHLTALSGLIARWSIGPGNDESSAELTLIGSAGRVTLRMPDDGAWSIMSLPEDAKLDFSGFDPEKVTHKFLEQACDNAAVVPNWEDACRALDMAELATESVRRGKTLAVHNQRLTEEDTFKSMMAAGGCFLLVLTLFLLLVVALVEGLNLPIREAALWKSWPAVLCATILVFLLLQLLRVFFPNRDSAVFQTKSRES